MIKRLTPPHHNLLSESTTPPPRLLFITLSNPSSLNPPSPLISYLKKKKNTNKNLTSPTPCPPHTPEPQTPPPRPSDLFNLCAGGGGRRSRAAVTCPPPAVPSGVLRGHLRARGQCFRLTPRWRDCRSAPHRAPSEAVLRSPRCPLSCRRRARSPGRGRRWCPVLTPRRGAPLRSAGTRWPRPGPSNKAPALRSTRPCRAAAGLSPHRPSPPSAPSAHPGAGRRAPP